ncbi:MAG TPA: tetratricopeptide repeat protein [Terriglobales bacterium]
MDSTAQASNTELRLGKYWKLLVCLLSFIAYLGTVRFDFVYDDGPLIVENPYIASWKHLPSYFGSHLFQTEPNVLVHYYRPLVLVWMLIQRKLFGLNPAGWHFTNVLLHVAVTYLACVLIQRLTADTRISFITGLLFGLHPGHIEVVSWASSASEMLLVIFAIGSFLCFIRAGGPENRTRWMINSLILFGAALLTKETACVLPAALFVYVWMYRAPDAGSLAQRVAASLKPIVPFLFVLLLYAAGRSLVFRHEAFHANAITIQQMVLSWPLLLICYLKLLLLPVRTSEFYDFYALRSFTFAKVGLPLVGILLLVGLLYVWQRRSGSKLVPFAALWTLFWLAPALYIRAFQPNELLHDRYAYAASLGVCALVALALTRIPAGNRQLLGMPLWQAVTTTALFLMMFWITINQQAYWANDLMLSYRGVMTAPLNNKPRIHLAEIFLNRGQLDKALPLYLDAYHRASDNWLATYNAGYIYYKFADWQQSKEYLDKTIQMNPRLPEAYTYRGLSEIALGQVDTGTSDLQRAASLDPAQPEIHMMLGAVSEREGKLPVALENYRRELAAQPANEQLRKHIHDLELRIGNSSNNE